MIIEGELLLNRYEIFLDEIFLGLQKIKVDVENFELDHICYRVDSIERYDSLAQKLKRKHTLLAESNVNGRPISNFLLKHPIIYKSRQISVLEVPSPKRVSNYQEGYEHVEFVIDGDLEYFINSNPDVDFDLKGFYKPINRDVRVSFGPLSVKFHEQTIREIIAIEQLNQSKAP
jgi:predicted metalloenzyme YecM